MHTLIKERSCKRLSESITVIPTPSRRPCLKPFYLELVLAIALMPEPLAAVASSNTELNERLLSTEGAAHPELGRHSSYSAHLNDDFVECVASIPPHP